MTAGRLSARCATTASRTARRPPAPRPARPSPSSTASSTSCVSAPTVGSRSCTTRASTWPGSTAATPRTGSVATGRSSCSSTSPRSTACRRTRWCRPGTSPRCGSTSGPPRRRWSGSGSPRSWDGVGEPARASHGCRRPAVKERAMGPEPEFEAYYGRQIIKTPTWKTPDVPLYLFLGGLAGGSAVLAEGAALSGNTRLEHVARAAAAGGAGGGTVFLVHDLGRPERFLYMLRVFKVTSPLSVGSYILAPFSGLASAALASQLTGRLPRLGRLAGLGSAAFGPPLVTYTAALLANTAVPLWHEAHRELPFVFAGSGAAATGGLAMALTPVAASGPAHRMAMAGAILELLATSRMESRLGMLAEPYEKGRSGALTKAARALTVAGLALSVVGGRSRTGRVLAGAAYLAGSVTTPCGVFEAALASSRAPKYIGVPQRERLAARRTHDHAPHEAPASPA